MDFRLNAGRFPSKKVYYIAGQKFVSDKGTKNGLKKAEEYAYTHMLNTKDIIKFDSELEYKFYLLLLKLEKEDKVSNIELHKSYLLIPEFVSATGTMHEQELYEADFVYYDKRINKTVVVDTKGFVEDVFNVKWKQFDYLYKNKGLALKVIRCRSSEYLNEDNWYEIRKEKQNKSLRKKQKEELTKLRMIAHQKKIEENKIKRFKARREELLQKHKLTSTERKRLVEIERTLKEKGILI